MRKRVFCIWSICLLALMPLLMGCDKEDEEEDLILVESFAGTDGMEGEKILFELKDVPAYVLDNSIGGSEYVSVFYSEHADDYWLKDLSPSQKEKIKDDIIKCRIAISLQELSQYDIPFNSKVYISAHVTNIIRRQMLEDETDTVDYWFDTNNWNRCFQKKAYLKDIRIRK